MTLRKADKLDHISLDYRTLKKDSHFGPRVFLFYFFSLIHIYVIIRQMLLSENQESTDLLKKHYASSSLSYTIKQCPLALGMLIPNVTTFARCFQANYSLTYKKQQLTLCWVC